MNNGCLLKLSTKKSKGRECRPDMQSTENSEKLNCRYFRLDPQTGARTNESIELILARRSAEQMLTTVSNAD